MAIAHHQARVVLERITRGKAPAELVRALQPKLPREKPLPPRLPLELDLSAAAAQRRRQLLAAQGLDTAPLAPPQPGPAPEALAGNIESLIGFAQLPIGIAGPLRVNGSHAQGDFYVPLATTEGALIASYNRGAALVSQAGGATALCLTESVSRAPCFEFSRLIEAGEFLSWVVPRFESLQAIVRTTSRHAQLLDMRVALTGKEVYLLFEFTTGDAAGQNMVTLATQALGEHLAANAPRKPRRWYVEGNLSGDKKATMLAFTSARGKDVVAEALLPARLVRRFLHTGPEELVRYWQVSMVGGVQSGSIGVQGHYANGLAALFIACGQDAGCVAEAAVGVTRLDLAEGGDLYVSVKLPNLIVGTVGGGTHLPTARACLTLLGCTGDGTARKFAEIAAATVLAGEVSIMGALAAGQFARAHAAYGRRAPRS
jgi:hydroxymethylglutaryl-CoA reductase (NADPH)